MAITTRYFTDDGNTFESLKGAQEHEKKLARSKCKLYYLVDLMDSTITEVYDMQIYLHTKDVIHLNYKTDLLEHHSHTIKNENIKRFLIFDKGDVVALKELRKMFKTKEQFISGRGLNKHIREGILLKGRD